MVYFLWLNLVNNTLNWVQYTLFWVLCQPFSVRFAPEFGFFKVLFDMTQDEITLEEFLEMLRKMHPRLTKRRMSLDAGLNANDISKIARGEKKADPADLYKIAMIWGGDNPLEKNTNYIRLLLLAGHPVPDMEVFDPENFSGLGRRKSLSFSEIQAALDNYSVDELLELAEDAMRIAREKYVGSGESAQPVDLGTSDDTENRSPEESDDGTEPAGGT